MTIDSHPHHSGVSESGGERIELKKDPAVKKSRSHSDYRLYLYLFLLAVGVRSLFLIFIDEPILFNKYPYFAEKLTEGVDIGERLLDLSPFYLYFLTLIKKMLNLDWIYVKTIQSLIGASNSLLLLTLGTRLFSRETGILSALIYAVYGNLIILESTLEPTVFVLLFNLLTLLFLISSRAQHRSKQYRDGMLVLAGLFCGISIITKPSFLLFLPIGVCFIFFSSSREASINIRIRQSMVFLTLSVLIILPITVRNYVKFDDFVLVTADAGKVFYHGNGKGASALEGIALVDEGFSEESTNEPDYAHVLYRETARTISGSNLSPSESSKFWFQKTFAEIIQDPMAYLLLQMKKFFYFFNDYEMHYIASAYKEYKQSLSFPFIRYGVIAALGILGMLLSLKYFRRLFLIYGMILLYLISGLIFLVQSRYRLPAVPYLCLFAGYAVSCLKNTLYQKKYRSVMAYLTVVVLSFIMVRFVYRVEINAMERWQKATKIYYLMEARPSFQMQKYDAAIEQLDRCLALAPNFSPAYNLRGKSHGMLGNSQDSLKDFLTVIRLSPNLAEGYKNLGFTYLILGKKEAAETYLQKAASFTPDDNKIKEALEHLKKQ